MVWCVIAQKRVVIWGILLVFVAGLVCKAQESNPVPPSEQTNSQEEPALSIGTELLQVDAVVTDKNGNPVRDLRKEDFELLENSKVQDIAFWSKVTGKFGPSDANPKAVPKPKSGSATEAGSRTFVMVVDDLHISPSNITALRKSLKSFLDQYLTSRDRLAVVCTSGNLGVLQQLTTDQRVMTMAVERLSSRTRQSASSLDQFQVTETQAFRIVEGDRQAIDLAVETYRQSFPGEPTLQASLEGLVQARATQIVSQISLEVSQTFGTLRGTINRLKHIPGRKAVIFATDGFQLDTQLRNNFAEMNKLIDLANRSGVAVYSISSAGLTNPGLGAGPTPPMSADQKNLSFRYDSQGLIASIDAMKAIAQETGGFAVYNSNDLTGALKRIAADNDVYYVLAYYPERTSETRDLKIAVRVKDRPGLFIRTRSSFVLQGKNPELTAAGNPDKEKKKEKKEKKPKKEKQLTDQQKVTVQLIDALNSFVPTTDVKLSLAGTFMASEEKDQPNTGITIAIDVNSITFEEKKDLQQNTLTGLFAINTIDGKEVMLKENVINVGYTKPQLKQAKRDGLNYTQMVKLDPGIYCVRVALRDPISGHIGTAAEWLEIPNLKKVKMGFSSLVLICKEQGGFDPTALLNMSALVGDGTPILPPGYKVVNQAVRGVQVNSRLGFVSQLFNVPQPKSLSEAAVSIQVAILQDGKQVVTTPPHPLKKQPDATGKLSFAAQIELDGLGPGEYVLQLNALAQNGKATASREQAFSILDPAAISQPE
ncbi:MAG: VWA domain-containing protein [Acidobacteria bacterium]|nr:VWA domain-containing protein [Acidobacteriota bacterium]